jgi:hypothetical protein
MTGGPEDHEDLTPKVTPELIARAQNGDADAARRLLEIFWAESDRWDAVPPALGAYIRECVGAFLDMQEPGRDASRLYAAFNLTRPRGRPPAPDASDTLLLAAMYFHELCQSGETRDDARQRAGTTYHVDPREVERTFDTHRGFIENDPFPP